ncbi:MAG: bifunctional (p)ppGpp synthetase/guanosine-3',5'-bis(diphosphate) 3'-pyrophosphohydrolase [Proteobacteria bacterium]|nr:bifunctional (p)ppGpp synthetase/guanosine-3',5'-bis(diphosphate) 3'-pyrophosphohydrolase [Pseudomonadota bacterium]
MIRQYELIDRIQKYNPDANVALLNKAFVFSMMAHGNQTRASGEPYLTHPLEVAALLIDLHMDEETIATALLHDTIEDTIATFEEIEEIFGKDVADMVEGVTKLSKLNFDDKKIQQAENYRKLFLAMSTDIRVLLIKLADRIHNMRTLGVMREEKRKRIAQDTLDIYVPLAHRIGLYKFKTELEDLCFKNLYPEEYDKIVERSEFVIQQEDLIDKVIEHLKQELHKRNINADVYGRIKTPYSIWRKMINKNLTFDQLTDIAAYRILVDDMAKCYEVLGMIHSLYSALPNRFKDYISNPKPNGYQSLHTSVIGPFGNKEEIQIRTKHMHEIAESGVAAHWLYKKQSVDKKELTAGKQYQWLKNIVESLHDASSAEEALENTKMELFRDEVFVFSPGGDLISLPRGASGLDFAFAIHSEVGYRCKAVKVNSKFVALRTELKNGDVVEIVTNKGIHPTKGWLSMVITPKAKGYINRYIKEQKYDIIVNDGKSLIEKALKKTGLKLSDKLMSPIMNQHKYENIDDAYKAVAEGRLSIKSILDILTPESSTIAEPTVEILETELSNRKSVGSSNNIGIDGLIDGLVVNIAKCCNPIPGDRIVGIITTGKGVAIHNKLCHNLSQYENDPERWLDISWSNKRNEQFYKTRIRVVISKERKALSTLTTTIFNTDVNILNFKVDEKDLDCFNVICEMELKDIDHFGYLMSKLRSLKFVFNIERIQG